MRPTTRALTGHSGRVRPLRPQADERETRRRRSVSHIGSMAASFIIFCSCPPYNRSRPPITTTDTSDGEAELAATVS